MFVIAFYFKNNILFMRANGTECSIHEYIIETWNGCAEKNLILGATSDSINVISVEFGEKIRELKKTALPFGEKIVREITKLACDHLRFVIAITNEVNKQRIKTKSGFIHVEKKN